MFHTIARLRQRGEAVRRENNNYNGVEHVPTCSTWPPPWLTEGVQQAKKPAAALTQLRVAAEPMQSDSSDLYERWEERVCIMHFDGRIPWRTAEALALADVLRQADPPAGDKANAGPTPETHNAKESANRVQAKLFASETGPYS
jgi:hypothetical protein